MALTLWSRRRASLRAAMLFELMIIGVLFAAVFSWAFGLVIHRSFDDIEQAEVLRNIGRAEAVLTATRSATEAHALDWGIWDESFDYLRHFDAPYEMRNINAASFRNAEITCVAFERFDGTGHRSFCFDAATDTPDPELAQALEAHVRDGQLTRKAAARPSTVSYWQDGATLYALATAQVQRSNGTGTPEGFLVFLHMIDAAGVAEALQMPARFHFDAASLSPVHHTDETADVLDIVTPVSIAGEAPVAMLEFSMSREMQAAGERLHIAISGAMLVLVAAMMLLLGQRLSTHVLAPVLAFRDHVERIRSEGTLVPLGETNRADEIGALGTAFNSMAAELETLRASHSAQSFALGREQSAIGLLHNLRNGLSPLSVILSSLERRLARSLPPESHRALSELASAETPPERRQRLVDYLAALQEETNAASDEARGLVREAGRSLADALEAIRVTREPGPVDHAEACELGSLLGHAARAARFVEGMPISVSIDCPQRLVARGNRVLLGQVFENLVVNATEAIRARGRPAGAIVIKAATEPQTGRCIVRISDDGEGFESEAAAQLFERGFSTRTDKRGGMGLHWCANTLTAMDGRLSLTSAGKGLGATAIVDLPAFALPA